MITSAFWSPPSARLSTPRTRIFSPVFPPQMSELPGSPPSIPASTSCCATSSFDGESCVFCFWTVRVEPAEAVAVGGDIGSSSTAGASVEPMHGAEWRSMVLLEHVGVASAISLGGNGTTAECSTSTIALSTRQLWMASTSTRNARITRAAAAAFLLRLLRNPNRDARWRRRRWLVG